LAREEDYRILELLGTSVALQSETRTIMKSPYLLLDNPSDLSVPRPLQWMARSKAMAVVWTAMRVWLGVMWIQAGDAKLWGKENAAFLHNGGAGVAGFAAHGVAAYSWWGTFLHHFVVPNAGWIGILVALSEFIIGVALVAGFLAPLASLASLGLLFTYVMSGTASVCAWYALFAIVLLAAWRTASWLGADGLIAGYFQRRHDRSAAPVVPAPSVLPLSSQAA
jgi:thiosulfate dehydrogenase [quinone] large subunit